MPIIKLDIPIFFLFFFNGIYILFNKLQNISAEILRFIVTWGARGPLDQISYIFIHTVLYSLISTFNMDLPGNACIKIHIYFKCVNNDFKNESVGDSE